MGLEDTAEVKAAKEAFMAAFAAAEAGDHAALAPVQGPLEYLADTEEVAAAKAAFAGHIQFKVPLPTWLTCPRLLRPRLPSRLPSMLMPMEKFLCPLPLCTLSLPLLLWLPQFWLLLITTTVTTVTPMPMLVTPMHMQVMQVTQVTQATTVTPMPMLDTQDTPSASPSWLPPLLLKP